MARSRIGKCVGCGARGRTMDGACTGCQKKFGAGCGQVMRRVREDPAFSLAVFEQFEREDQRALFIEMFGDPRR